MKLTTEDFKPLGALVKGYELEAGKHYLLIVDGRGFDYGLANALLSRLREEHPEICAHIIATIEPKKVDVRETTLADELEALVKDATDHQTIPNLAEIDLSTFLPVMNRAIKALRGEHGPL